MIIRDTKTGSHLSNSLHRRLLRDLDIACHVVSKIYSVIKQPRVLSCHLGQLNLYFSDV
jgi:hypothetical protein